MVIFPPQQWELLVLQTLGWDLSSPTPFSVLDLLLRLRGRDAALSAAGFHPPTVRRHAETLAALCATEFSLSRRAGAGLTACACLLAACGGLRATRQQGLEVERLLSELASVSGLRAGEIAKQAERIEEVMRERMPLQHQHPPPPPEDRPTAKLQNSSSAVVSSSSANPSCNAAASSSSSVAASANPPPPSSSPTDLMEMAVACAY